MVFKLLEAAQKSWRRLDGHNLTALEIYRANLMTKLQASTLSDLVRLALISIAEPPAED